MKRHQTDLIYAAGLLVALALALSPFFVLSKEEKDKNLASWLQVSVGGAGMLLVALTLELQRHQIRENTETTQEASELTKKQVALLHSTLRAQIQPLLGLQFGRDLFGGYGGRVTNVGKDLAILRSIHFNNAALNVSGTGFDRFIPDVLKRLQLEGLRIPTQSMQENSVLQRGGDASVFSMSLRNPENAPMTVIEENRRNFERLLKAIEGTEVTLNFDNVLKESEPVLREAMHYVEYRPNG